MNILKLDDLLKIELLVTLFSDDAKRIYFFKYSFTIRDQTTKLCIDQEYDTTHVSIKNEQHGSTPSG